MRSIKNDEESELYKDSLRYMLSELEKEYSKIADKYDLLLEISSRMNPNDINYLNFLIYIETGIV